MLHRLRHRKNDDRSKTTMPVNPSDNPQPPAPLVRGLRPNELLRRCPLTLATLEGAQLVAECRVCHALHDLSAWQENEGCGTLGCQCAPNMRRDHPERVVRFDGSTEGSRPRLPPNAIAPSQPRNDAWPTDRIVIRVEGHPVVAPVQVDRVPARPPPPPILGDGVATGTGPSSRPLPIAPRSATSPPPPPPPPPIQTPPPIPTQNPHRTSPRSLPKLGIHRPIRNDEPQRQCPYSLEALVAGMPAVECRSCGQVLLASAWEENGGCTTYGCDGAPDFRKDAL